MPPVDHDIDPQRDGSYSREQLYRFMWETRLEPEWRKEAELAMAFYDGDQLDREILMKMKQFGMAPVIINVTAPTIDAVAGWETITRADLNCIPETEESYEAAMGLNVKFKEALRMTRFNQMIGHGFKRQVQMGLATMEVSRNPDPYGYPYRVGLVPWRECFYDYRARNHDYSDARYMLRRRWLDRDDLVRHMPQHRKEIEGAVTGFADGWTTEWGTLGDVDIHEELAHSLEQEFRWTLEEDEWRHPGRGRVCLYEILYTVPRIAETLRTRDGRVMAFDREHPIHVEALRRGLARHQRGVTAELRQAFYLGPIRLEDHPLPNNKPHYIPMVGYRKDNDGSPYGLVARMISAQKALNARHTRMLFDTANRRYIVDDDAVDDPAMTKRELNKLNAFVVLRADRRGEVGLQELPTTDKSSVTFQLLQEAKVNLFEVTGLHPEFMGRTIEAGRSGVAIETLVEQTTQVLGIIVDNYRNAKLRAAERLFDYIVDDTMDLNDVGVDTDMQGDGKRHKIVLNRMRADGLRDNDVVMAHTRIALGETPASVTYLQQKFQQLTEIIKSMPPEMQAVMMDLVVRAAALPESEEMLERIRELTGYGPEPKDPQKRQAMIENQQRQQELQQRMEQLQMMITEAELMATQAKAAHDKARADKAAGADTDLTEAKTISELAQVDVLRDEQDRKEMETRAKTIEASARLASAANQADAKKASEAKKKSGD